MRHDAFRIGATFWCDDRQWRCTDIGRRTVIAIRTDQVTIESTSPKHRRVLNDPEADAEGWFRGPPYTVAEHVFDEDSLEACSPTRSERDKPDPAEPPLADEGDITSANDRERQRKRARGLRAQARAGGLHFGAYLPPDLADWMLDAIAHGVFADPGEAVFALVCEHRDLEPHTDLREEMMRRACQKALDDPRPPIPHDEVVERLKQWAAQPRPAPAVWRRGR